jgi:hypothetical protein
MDETALVHVAGGDAPQIFMRQTLLRFQAQLQVRIQIMVHLKLSL